MSTPSTAESQPAVPEQLAEIIEEFQEVPDQQKLELLLDFSRELPDPPEHYQVHREEMEQVVECQSPLFLAVEFDDASGTAQLIIAAPPEAPTTRGFASIIYQGLNGLGYAQILGVPDDLPQRLGLASAITPLRLRGMSGILGRVKRLVREHTD